MCAESSTSTFAAVSSLEVAVIGAGAWGTALADHLARLGHRVSLWCFEPAVALSINTERVNTIYLPGHRIDGRVTATTELERAVRSKVLVVIAVPSHHVRSLATQLNACLRHDTLVVSATKGIETESLLTMSGVYSDVFTFNFHNQYCVLSGPSFAREVAQAKPTAVTVAAWNPRTAERVQQIFSTPSLRCYTSTDVIGVELGGALKNVVAIAVGAVDGIGIGHNARAGLMTRALAQITRIGVPLGANPLTLAGLSGAGDLILTCTSDQSRNRTFGLRLGQGQSVASVLSSQPQVVEGYLTSKSVYDLIRQLDVRASIFEQLYLFLHRNEDNRPITHFVERVLHQQLKAEMSYA